MSAATSIERAEARLPGRPWRRAAVLGSVTAIALWFITANAVPYVVPDVMHAGRYVASRRAGLLLHIASGTVALLVGPVQLWLGLGRTRLGLHRRLGLLYVASVALGSASAFYLASTTRLGWVFGMGLAGLGVAWLVTTGLALAAIRRRQIPQHAEWMIRSYVVTFAFVTFRVLWAAFHAAEVGTLPEQLAAASWSCWSVPLLFTEAILQGRKILAAPLLRPGHVE
jgi:hypothetical protein